MQTKWKYKVVRMKTPVFAKIEERTRIVQDNLDRLGMEGWELVHVIMNGVSDAYPTFYLKRPY